MNKPQKTDSDVLRMDVSKLNEKQLEELAQIVVRKLRSLMKQEADRSGRA